MLARAMATFSCASTAQLFQKWQRTTPGCCPAPSCKCYFIIGTKKANGIICSPSLATTATNMETWDVFLTKKRLNLK